MITNPETFPPCKILPVDGTVVQHIMLVKNVFVDGMASLNSQSECVSDALG